MFIEYQESRIRVSARIFVTLNPGVRADVTNVACTREELLGDARGRSDDVQS